MKSLFFALFALTPLLCVSQNIELVKDIGTVPNSDSHQIENDYVVWNDKLFYAANAPGTSVEPWVSDGTAAGTFLLKDIRVGVQGSAPEDFVANELGVFFSAQNDLGRELWMTDGTPEGTRLVKDVYPGPSSGEVTGIIAIPGKVLFSAASDETGNLALWETDGTTENTQLFMQLNEGGTYWHGVQHTYGDKVLFEVNISPIGTHPWITDGTVEGTFALWNNGTGMTTRQHIEINGVLYFMGSTVANGQEIFRSDGTAEGTYILKDIHSGSSSAIVKDLIEFNGELYFTAYTSTNGRQVWKSDGTEAGTIRISDIDAFASQLNVGLGELTVLNDKVYFKSPSELYGAELWSTSGTLESTALTIDLNPGDDDGDVSQLFAWNNALYFRGEDDGDNGAELWRLDGTTNELEEFDLLSGSGDSNPRSFKSLGDKLFFEAEDADGFEPFITDGTLAGTLQLADINETDSSVLNIVKEILGDKLVFAAEIENWNEQLFATDGTPEGTAAITDERGQQINRIRELTVFDGKLYFNADDWVSGQELWVSDGTPEGTYMHSDLVPGSNGTIIWQMYEYNGKLIFSTLGGTDKGLFVLDSEEEDIYQLIDIWPGEIDEVENLEPMGEFLYFTAEDEGGPFDGPDLWRTDGTLEGTEKVKNYGGSSSNPEHFFGVGETLWFFMEEYGSTSSWGLHKSDGTSDGTVQVEQHSLGGNNWGSFDLTPYENGVFYTVFQLSNGRELYYSDGTPEGSFLVQSLAPGSESPGINSFTEYNGWMYFIATTQDGSELWRSNGPGFETEKAFELQMGPESSVTSEFARENLALWNNELILGGAIELYNLELCKTDGTLAGTSLIKEINPNGASNPQNFFVGQNYVYFTADDGVHGFELWRTDGTEVGTTFLGDALPGPGSSLPQDFIELDGYLYFTAFGDNGGRELFRIDQRCIVPEISIASTAICVDETVTIATEIMSQEGELTTMQWDFGDGTVVEMLNASHAYDIPGEYSADLLLETTTGCTYTQSITLSVGEAPLAEIGAIDAFLCQSETWTPENITTGTTANTVWAWDFGAAGTSDVENPEVNFPEIGNYNISLQASNGICASEIIQLQAEVYTPTIAKNENTTVTCAGGDDGSVLATGAGPFAPISYSLTAENYQDEGLFENLTAGIYTFYLQDIEGCIGQQDVELLENPAIEIDITTTGDDGNDNGSISVGATGGVGMYQYSIDEGENWTDVFFYENLTQGNYIIQVQDAVGCIEEVDVTVDFIDAIVENNAEKWTVFPNPTSDQITVQWPSASTGSELWVYDSFGRIIKLIVPSAAQEVLDVSNWAAGIYLLRISNSSFSQRLVVRK